MILGTGVDATSIAQVEALIERFGERFLRRAFTAAENDYCQSRRRPAESYAARFAAKEAVMKALRSGWGSGVRFREIEVKKLEHGAPAISLSGGAQKKAAELGVERIHVSLTHEQGLAIASVVVEEKG